MLTFMRHYKIDICTWTSKIIISLTNVYIFNKRTLDNLDPQIVRKLSAMLNKYNVFA